MKFYTVNGKRRVLVVDDEFINREILSNVLEESYDVILAENGAVALEQIKANRDTLSAVLLDIIMPVMTGLELLKILKSDPALSRIPVIVLTSDSDSEVASLDLGAADFIPKPYPRTAVILARVRKTIELSEDRQIIDLTERDALTGLYNREFFYRYAEQFDQHNRDTATDAIVMDIQHFHIINERFGNAYGDTILKSLGNVLLSMADGMGGIVCRRNADSFMIYCPHTEDHESRQEEERQDRQHNALSDGDSAVHLRMGVYPNAERSLAIERRFDRAKAACDKARASYTHSIEFYDNSLHDKELYEEQLIDCFDAAVEEKQFKVFYQPKYDITAEKPVLAGAEALVRWVHPEYGMISPGVFIPLFEDKGLIEKLDEYVWATAADRVADWKKRFGRTIPVSVNVSRIDMYDPDITAIFKGLIEKHALDPGELHLEITESAYTDNSEQMIKKVGELRDIGFRIEMDDFGTGYSSLNMISRLPIDLLKLDMQFIRGAFAKKRDTKLLEIIMEIAKYLGVPTIAEGVETEEQYLALKEIGCDLIQGYYFSKPVPAEEFEKFIAEPAAV